jgi:glutathione S-transferase
MPDQSEVKITVHWRVAPLFGRVKVLTCRRRLESSRVQPLIVLLEELSLVYEIKTYTRDKNALAPEELRKVHPLGKSPSLEVEIPGHAPFVLAETGSIFEYLCENFGRHLIPATTAAGLPAMAGAESEEFRRNRYFMHYAEGNLMSLLTVAAVMLSMQVPKEACFVPVIFHAIELTSPDIKNAPGPVSIKPITRMITSKIDDSFLGPSFQTHFDFLEDQLKSSPCGGSYLCGKEVAEADFMMILPIELCMSWAGLTSAKFPKLCAYLDLMRQRESFKVAEKKIVEIEGSFKPVLH